jgi:hypothetical protein
MRRENAPVWTATARKFKKRERFHPSKFQQIKNINFFFLNSMTNLTSERPKQWQAFIFNIYLGYF